MNSCIVSIRGMHCKSCEILIERHIKKIAGVLSVKANQSKGIAKVHFTHKPSDDQFAQAVQNAGYEIGSKEKLPWFSRNVDDYLNLALVAIGLVIIFVSANGYGLFSLSFAPSGTGLAVALLVGLVAGVSTCMALIGGLVLGIAARHSELHPEATPLQKFRPHLLFNAGRIAGYAVFGGIIGLIGKVFQPSPNVLGILTIVVGLVMIFLGLKLIEIFPALRDTSFALPASIGKALGMQNDAKQYSHWQAVTTGALTFFLPCGFTQAMQLYAVSTGSFASGALIMGLFALGTAPGLLSVAGLASALKGQAARTFFMAAGLVVILLGSYNIVTASRLLSFGYATQPAVASDLEPQIVNMTQTGGGYSPNSFTIEKGRPVQWVITSQDSYTCAASIVMPKYRIRKSLQLGRNVIEFTPTETGTISFTCSMGMYRGTFTVVESGTKSTGTVNATGSNSIAVGSTCSKGGGCGGCGGSGKPAVLKQGEVAVGEADGTQILRSAFTVASDMQPNSFTVKNNVPVEIDLDAQENGRGCMGSIKIPGLVDTAQQIRKGSIKLAFTPTVPGTYPITCAMGVPRGQIVVAD